MNITMAGRSLGLSRALIGVRADFNKQVKGCSLRNSLGNIKVYKETRARPFSSRKEKFSLNSFAGHYPVLSGATPNKSQRITASWNHGMSWVGRKLKDNIVPTF